MSDPAAISIPLADTIKALRAELVRAMTNAQGEELRFAPGEVELELAMEISAETGADAGIRFGVVSIGAKGTASEAQTHRIKMKLQPELRSSERVLISDEEGE
jgi:hypothetical protein